MAEYSEEEESEEEPMCGEVCGVGEDEDDEEGSDGEDEEVSPFKRFGRRAEDDGEEVNIFKAVKDERRIKEIVNPRRPSEKEVKEHEVHHLPYRNWCAICVKAKGKYMDHRKSIQEEKRSE